MVAVNTYKKTLYEYINKPIFIADNINQLDKEIYENCMKIGGKPSQIKALTVKEWKKLIADIIENRRMQLQESHV